MKQNYFVKYFWALMAFGFVLLNSCNEDNSTINTPDNNSDYVIANDMVINGTLKTKEYDMNSESYVFNAWKKGAGRIVASSSTTTELGTGTVDADGNFSLSLKGKILKSNLTDYVDLSGSLSHSPASFKCLIIPVVIAFYPDGSDVMDLLDFGIVKSDNSQIQTYFGFVYSDQTASITGSTDNGDIYNLLYKKGWNIWQWEEKTGGITEFTTVNSLPSNIVWF